MVYRMTLWSNLKFIWPSILLFAIILYLPLYHGWDLSIFNTKLGLFLIPVFILFLLPPLVIHLLYYLNDRRKTVEINKETGSICFISNDINECFSKDDIKSIDIFINNGFRSPLKGYYYAKITLQNGKYKMVTCLTITDLSHFPFITQKDELIFPMITNNENWIF